MKTVHAHAIKPRTPSARPRQRCPAPKRRPRKTRGAHFHGGELNVLERIAEFSAKVRGHELGKWQTGEGMATARCTRCGRELRVYRLLLYPSMDGPALDAECDPGAAARVA